ncbi:MAG: hypothetical protein ACR2LN_01230 [Candidatus Levyibacteriota bacterium]
MGAAISELMIEKRMQSVIDGRFRGATNARILPRGTSYVHIDPDREELGFGTKPTDAARNNQVVDKNTRRGHLEKEFFGHYTDEPSRTHIHGGATLIDNGRVSVVGQPAGYFEISGLVVATDLPELSFDELVRKQNEVVPAIFPTDLPDATQLAYTGARLAGLQTAHEFADAGKKSLLIEHLTPIVKTPTIKIPRSIPWAHVNYGNVDKGALAPERGEVSHLQAEQDVLDSDYLAFLSLYMYTIQKLIIGI